jgi:hypothetical protein
LTITKKDDSGYYLWQANSNQWTDSGTEETLQQKEYHQLYIFGQRVIEFDIEELAKQFQSSSVVIADILTIVFTFTSAWYYKVAAAAGDGTPKNNKMERNQPQKKVTSYPLISTPARKQPEKDQEKVAAVKKWWQI